MLGSEMAPPGAQSEPTERAKVLGLRAGGSVSGSLCCCFAGERSNSHDLDSYTIADSIPPRRAARVARELLDRCSRSYSPREGPQGRSWDDAQHMPESYSWEHVSWSKVTSPASKRSANLLLERRPTAFGQPAPQSQLLPTPAGLRPIWVYIGQLSADSGRTWWPATGKDPYSASGSGCRACFEQLPSFLPSARQVESTFTRACLSQHPPRAAAARFQRVDIKRGALVQKPGGGLSPEEVVPDAASQGSDLDEGIGAHRAFRCGGAGSRGEERIPPTEKCACSTDPRPTPSSACHTIRQGPGVGRVG